jgi:hypothetical protein
MHGYNELGHLQSAPLLGISQVPDAAEDVVGQACALEYLLRLLASQDAALGTRLLEQRRVLPCLIRCQRGQDEAPGQVLGRGRPGSVRSVVERCRSPRA